MCRSSAEGGRRCPCTDDRGALDAHNERRRKGRALRSAAVAWAAADGLPRTALEVLAAAPPGVVASWARRAGAPAEVFDATNQRRVGDRQISDGSWATPGLISLIANVSAAQGSAPEETPLFAGEVVATAEVEEGVNDTLFVELDTGVAGYHKAFSALDEDTAQWYGQSSALQPIHEVSAWVLARELGEPFRSMVPPTVLRTIDGRLGSFARAVNGTIGFSAALDRIPGEQLDAAAFFDALIGQQDRNPTNFLTDDAAGQLHLIDHGFAFARPGDHVGAELFVRIRHNTHRATLSAAELALLDRVIEAPHLGVPPLLEPERGAAVVDRARRMRLRGYLLDAAEV